MFKMKKFIISKSLPLFIINLALMFVVFAKSNHDHHHHHHSADHLHGHKTHKAKQIYNGRRASRDEAKFMAAILKPRGGGLLVEDRIWCSAVIITHDTVLTAAHCLANETKSDIQRMEILPGASRINTVYYRLNRDLIRSIKTYWIHPEYEKNTSTYDLAVIKVGSIPWRLDDDQRRVTVAQMPVRVKRQRPPFKAYGYGMEAYNREYYHMTGFLNAVEYTREYSQSYCELMFGSISKDRDIVFATKERSHPHQLHISSGQAWGDSGGGIFLHGTVERLDTVAKTWIKVDTEILVGIASHHITREETMRVRFYFFFTNVTTFLPWIKRYSDARFETYPFPYPLR